MVQISNAFEIRFSNGTSLDHFLDHFIYNNHLNKTGHVNNQTSRQNFPDFEWTLAIYNINLPF